MADEIGAIKVRIGADDSELQSKLKSAAGSVAKWSAGTVAAASAVAVAFTKAGLSSADALAKQAQQLNTSSSDLAKLKRAADLAGVSQSKLEGASRALTTRLSMAASGTGDAAKALDRLGLSAAELQRLPLTERIQTINQALANNVSASERAGIAAKIFGEEAGLAVSQIDPATISRAADEVDRFGSGLNGIQSAQIEAANDSLSQFGLAFDGLSRQMAAEFAPLLDAIGQQFGELADDSGFFKDTFGGASDFVVSAAGGIADAFAVTGRSIQTLGEGGKILFNSIALSGGESAQAIVEAFEVMRLAVLETFNAVIRAANNIPGVNLSEIVIGQNETLDGIKSFNAGLVENIQNAKNEIGYIWSAELPSEGIKASFELMKAMSEEAALDVAAARDAALNVTNQGGGEGQESPELVKMREDAQKKLELLKEQWATEDELMLERREAEMAVLQEGFDMKLLAEEDFLLQKAMLDEKYLEEEYARKEAFKKAEEELNKAKNTAQLNVAKSMFGNLSSLMSTENKKLFEIGKAAAIAEATVKGYEAIQSSYAQGSKIGGPPVGAAFAATAAVATAVQVANIAKTQFGSASSAMAPAAGGGSVPVGTSQGAQTPVSVPSGTLTVEGLSAGSLFTGEAVSQLAEELLDFQKRGGVVVLR